MDAKEISEVFKRGAGVLYRIKHVNGSDGLMDILGQASDGSLYGHFVSKDGRASPFLRDRSEWVIEISPAPNTKSEFAVRKSGDDPD